MSDADFTRAIGFVLQREGGYVADPNDRGGETNFGISKRQYPKLDVKHLTAAQATEIYHEDYWIKAGCDALPWPAGLVLLDTAVNMGVPTGDRLWRSAGGVDPMLWARLDQYRKIVLGRPADLAFLPGWLRRMVLLHEAAR